MARRILLLVTLIGVLAGCTAPQTSRSAPSVSRPPLREDASLRIANDGLQDIAGLVVFFPGPTADAPARRVEFGDVPAGQTTDYRPSAEGVYRYAAYEYTVSGAATSQKVADWVGEVPLPGDRYTYHVRYDAAKPSGRQIELVKVQAD